MFTIKLSELRGNPSTVQKYHYKEEFPSLTLAGEKIEFSTPVEVDIQVENMGLFIIVRGQIQTRVYRACSRCLEMVDSPILPKFELTFIHQDDLEAAGIDEDSDAYEVFGDDPVNLQEIVMETILMALPMTTICQEECQGLCPNCGINLNYEKCNCESKDIDPRLAVLQNLFKKRV